MGEDKKIRIYSLCCGQPLKRPADYMSNPNWETNAYEGVYFVGCSCGKKWAVDLDFEDDELILTLWP